MTRMLAVFSVNLALLAPGLAAQARPITPVGNYHAHLVSDSTARMLVVPRLQTIELPTALVALVREFESAAGSGMGKSVAALFTEDGLYGQPTGWVQGRERIEHAVSNERADKLRVRPHQVTTGEATATISASLTDSTHRDVAKATFMLRRSSDSRWLIASLLRENIPEPTSTSGGTFKSTELVAQLDSAGIQRALVLSAAYWFGSALMPGTVKGLTTEQEYARVKWENDWVASESARYPTRLIPFCSFHPLKSYALTEIERCARHPQIRGIKLHLANSGVDLRNPADVAQLRKVFAAANTARLPIVVHMRPRLQPYGRQDAEHFLREVLSAAPDIPIQIAHFAGWGGFDDSTDAAIGAFVDAIAARNPATSRLSFDFTAIVFPGQAEARLRRIAERLRQIGLNRVVYGSDLGDPKPDWANILRLLPLTRTEFETLAANVTPVLELGEKRVR